MLGFFSTFLGVAFASHLKIVWETIFGRFSNLWIFKNAVKTNDFWRFLHLLHDRSWDRSWIDFGSILPPQIVPKSDPKRFRQVSNFLVVFARPPGPPKIDLMANMAPTWAQLGPQDVPKLGLKWRQNRTKNGLGSEGGPWTDFGPILDPFGTDFGSIWNRFGTDFGLIFARFWFNFRRFSSLCVCALVRVSSPNTKQAAPSRLI